MTSQEKVFNKNILIAVDESENARRAVSYVGQLLQGAEGFRIGIVHVVPEPDEDFFETHGERIAWIEKRRKKADVMLDDYRNMLIDAGFRPNQVSTRSTLRTCPSLAECILDERDETDYSTIVVGRQGLSRSEEFLFGSVSSKIVNHAKNCTVWVVE
jgi:nucleotide-binding universal stress UspA family protein